MELTHFSLFSGIGGIDLAAEMAGFTSIGQVEWADFPNKVLNKNWPNVPKWRDVRDVTAESIRNMGIRAITVLSAGFPCQPYSSPGKRKGHEDERDMWGETSRLISELQPTWFVGENVNGIINMALDGIVEEIREKNYEVEIFNIPAIGVGARHERYRIFIVGHSNSKSKPQTNKSVGAFRSERKAWENTSGEFRREIPGTYWETHKPPICGVDDGLSTRFYKDRMKALGNAVVPYQIYPLFKAIAAIENNVKEELLCGESFVSHLTKKK